VENSFAPDFWRGPSDRISFPVYRGVPNTRGMRPPPPSLRCLSYLFLAQDVIQFVKKTSFSPCFRNFFCTRLPPHVPPYLHRNASCFFRSKVFCFDEGPFQYRKGSFLPAMRSRHSFFEFGNLIVLPRDPPRPPPTSVRSSASSTPCPCDVLTSCLPFFFFPEMPSVSDPF